MKTVSLSGSPRENVGKKDAKTLRKQGRVPGVLYGGENQVHFHVDRVELEKLIYTPDVYQIELDIAGTVTKCIIQEMQFHPVTDLAVHMDMLQLADNKPVKVALPVRVTGNAVGVIAGGTMLVNFRKLNVLGMPSDLPEDITIDISDLNIGDNVRIGSLDVPGCTITHAESAVVVAVKATRVSILEGEDEEGEAEEGEAEEATEEASEE